MGREESPGGAAVPLPSRRGPCMGEVPAAPRRVAAFPARCRLGVVGNLAVDMGAFIYPITFTLRDLAHKCPGRAVTRTLILTAGGVNLLMAAYLMWTASVPADNVIFALGAFAFALPWNVVWEIFLFNLLVKYGLTLLSLPLIYLAPERFGRGGDD